jgi:hypothetical protein
MPSLKVELKISAARYALGDLPSWEMPVLANAMLDGGMHSAAVVELATLRHATMADAGPLFERALAEVAIDLPSEQDAVWILLRHYLKRIATGEVRGKDGLKPVMDLYDLAGLHEKTLEYAGDSHGLHHLVGAYSGYDDLYERPTEVSVEGLTGAAAVDALDKNVARLAREWSEQHGA